MLDILIITIGRLKTSYWCEAELEYLKRLKPYVNLEIKELAFSSFAKHSKEKVKAEEAEKIEKAINLIEGQVFLLSEEGKLFDSVSFSQNIYQLSHQKIVFVIAGSLGFSLNLKKKYPQISLSTLTFTHEMARVILLEQIYRAASIEKGKDYHY